MAKKAPISVDRDQQILNRLAKIEHKVDSLEQTTAFALRADADRHIESVRDVFGKSKRKAQVYLAADGSRSVGEIAEILGKNQPNVSADLRKLQEEGLLEIVDSNGGTNYWGKTPVDRTVRISPFLCKEFDLNKDGTER